MKRKLVFLPIVFFFASCATVTRGVHEKLRVESNPRGAEVRLSTGETGVTPATFVKKRRTDNFTVTFSKTGYVSQTIKVESRPSGTGGTAMAGNALVGGLIGIGIDAASGAYDSLYPNPVSVVLVPKKEGTARNRAKTKQQSSEDLSLRRQ